MGCFKKDVDGYSKVFETELGSNHTPEYGNGIHIRVVPVPILGT